MAFYQPTDDLTLALQNLRSYDTNQDPIQDPAYSAINLYSLYSDDEFENLISGKPMYDAATEDQPRSSTEGRGWITGGETGGGALLDFHAHGLWNLFDTALMGIPDLLDIDDYLWGEDYEDRLERGDFAGDSAQLWGGGIGGFMGFVAPTGPLKIGGAITKGITSIPRMMKVGNKLTKQIGTRKVDDLTKWSEKALPKNVNLTDEAIDANATLSNNLRHFQHSWKNRTNNTDVWFGKSDSFKRNIQKHIDDAVNHNVSEGIWDAKTAARISDVYKKIYNNAPVTDFTELVTKYMPGKFGYGVGSILDEAFMFGTIDGLLEGIEAGERWSKGDGWHYDYMHPVWGTITGGLFGTLKWLPKGGKASSSQKDFQQGLRTFFGLTPKRIASKNETQLTKYVETQGNILRQGSLDKMVKKSKTPELKSPDLETLTQKPFKYKGQDFDVDLTNVNASVKAILKGSNVIDNADNRTRVLKAIATHLDRTAGKEAMGWLFKNSSLNWTNFAENWHRMILAAGFMNARTVNDYVKGNPVDAESTIMHVLLGAFVGRKGIPRRQDFVGNQIAQVRWYMNNTGLKTQHLYLDMPSYDPRYTEATINPLANDHRLAEVTRLAEKLGLTTDHWSDRSVEQNWMAKEPDNVGMWQGPNKPLFMEFFKYLTGGAGTDKMYTMPLEMISKENAREIVSYLKQHGIETPTKFREIALKAIDKGNARLEEAIVSAAIDIRKLNLNEQVLTGSNNAADIEIGRVTKDFSVTQELLDRARNGEIEGLGKGNEAVNLIQDVVKKAKNINQFVVGMGRGKHSNETVYIEKAQEIINLKEAIENRERQINEQMKLKKDVVQFKFDSPIMEDFANVAIVKNFKRKATEVSDLFDPKHPEFRELLDVLKEAGIIQHEVSKIGAEGQFEIPYNISNIKINTNEFAALSPDAQARLNGIKKFARDIMAAKAGVDFSFSDKGTKWVNVASLEKLGQYLRQRGINTERPEVLRELGEFIQWQALQTKKEGSTLKENDLILLSNLMDPSVRKGDKLHPFVKFAGLKDKNITGWKIDLIDLERVSVLHGEKDGLYKIAEEYNTWAEKIIERGRTEDGSQLVQRGDKIQVVDSMNIRAVQAAMDLANIYSSKRAGQTLFEFFNVVEGNSNVRDALASLAAQGHEAQFAVLKMLYDFKIIKTVKATDVATKREISDAEKGDPAVKDRKETSKQEAKDKDIQINEALLDHDIVIDRAAWEKPENLKRFQDFLNNEGINMKSIEENAREVNAMLEDILTMSHTSSHSTITQADYFRQYFPKSYAEGSLETAEGRNKFIKEAIFENGEFRKDLAIKEIFRRMEREGTANPEKIDNVYDHTMQIISNYIEQVPVEVLYYSHGTVQSKKVPSSIYRSSFTEFMNKLDIKMGFIEGISTNWAWNDSFNRPYQQVVDIFTANSDKLSSADRTAIQAARERFENHLDRHLVGTRDEIAIIPIPGKDTGNRMFVSKKDFGKIQTAFESFVKELVPGIEAMENSRDKAYVKEKLEKMMTEMQKEGLNGNWRDVHTDAFQVLMFNDMLTGKDVLGNTNRNILDYLKLPKGSSELENLDARFNLYSRMKFKRFNKDLMEAQLKAMDYVKEDGMSMSRHPRDINTLNYYKNKGGFKAIVWNDKYDARMGDASIQKDFNNYVSGNNIKGKDGKLLTWERVMNGKADETGFDSIAWISSKFSRLNALQHGASKDDAQIFKAHIASNGESIMFYGKTVLVHSPVLERTLFKKNPDLDVVFAHSADKLKTMEKQNNLLDVTWKELGSEIDVTDRMFDLPFESVAISKVPDYNSYAKTSPTFMNNDMNSEYNHAVFESFHKEYFDKARTGLSKIIGRPLAENEAIRMIKRMDIANVQDIYNSGDSGGGHGVFLDYVNFSNYGSPSALGRNGVLKILKERFIDEAMAPESVFRGTNGEPLQYGGKSVLVQHPNSREYDLAPTVVDYADGSIKKYGQMMLPAHMKEMPIDFQGRDSHVYVILKEGNKIRKAKDVFIEMQSEMQKIDQFKSKESPEDLWRDMARQSNALETLVNWFEFINTTPELFLDYPGLSKYAADVAMSVSRFPRTRPNDLALLRVKGFMEGGGNQMVINKSDVYTIFEGDYDVDMADYFWGMNRGMVDHIQKQHRNWTTPPRLDLLNPVPHGSLEMGSLNSKRNVAEWDKFDANKRVMKNLIGTVQSTTGKVNHVADVAEVRNIAGRDRNIVIVDRQTKGQKHFVEVDWNNADWFERQALEAQAIIDFKNGVDPSLLKGGARNYLDNYLFPTMQESSYLGEYGSNMTKFDQNLRNRTINQTGKRIRMFRRWEKIEGEWRETDLKEIDKDIIKIMMREYNKTVKMMPGRKIHAAGEARTPGYLDLMNTASDYFNYARNVDNSIYTKLAGMRIEGGKFKYDRNSGDLADYFGIDLRTRVEGKRLQKRDPDAFEKNRTSYEYTWRSGDPFAEGLKQNYSDRANPDGTKGSFAERALKELWTTDPLNVEKDMQVLTGREFRDYEMIEHMMLDGVAPISELSKAFPKIKKDVSNAKSHLLRLKKQAAKHWWWSKNSSTKKMRDRNKEALAAVNEQITKLEQSAQIQSVIGKEYYKSRKWKDLKDIDIVDIQSNKDVIDGTVQYYVTASLYKGIYDKRGENYDISAEATTTYRKELQSAVYEFMKETGTEYGMRNYADMYTFGRKSIHNEMDYDRLRQSGPKEIAKIEQDAMDRITQRVIHEELGFDFLYALARPKANSINNKVGIFRGKVMPVATTPNSNYARALRWLTMAATGRLDIPTEIQQLSRHELLKWQKIDFMWRNFLSGHKGLGDMPASDLVHFNMYDSGMPEWSRATGNLFNSYNNVKVGYFNHIKNPFGMGDPYGKKFQFLRSLLSIAGLGNDDVNSLSKTFSYTAQLMAENQYMNPLRYHSIMKNIQGDINFALNSVTPEKGKLPWMSNIATDRINHVINSAAPDAVGFNVNAMYNKRELQLMQKMTRQAESIRETQGDIWQDIKDNMKVQPKEKC